MGFGGLERSRAWDGLLGEGFQVKQAAHSDGSTDRNDESITACFLRGGGALNPKP